jgi:pyruvate-formate lyase-activating enzyme
MGETYISDRIYKSKIYTNEELNDAYTTDFNEDINLHTLEIAFDRTCNFACSYCNPAFSTTWVKDLKNNGGYTDLVSDGRNHFTHSHDSNQLFGLNEYNPYVEAFFKWWDSDLHSTLRELRITGGEPIMSPELWKLLDWFKKEDNTSDCSIVINSNLGGKPELIDRLVEARTHLPSLDVYTSCESTGVKAEYIRDGLDFNYWWDNLVRLHEAGIDTHCMMTINALCLHTLPALISKILAKRTELNTNRFAIMSLNILRFPSFQSALVLPRDIKISCSNQLKELINQDMHEFERGQIKRLIEYLQVINTPHNEAFEMPKLHNDFKQFYQQYDVRRNKNFETTFPELKDWFNTL